MSGSDTASESGLNTDYFDHVHSEWDYEWDFSNSNSGSKFSSTTGDRPNKRDDDFYEDFNDEIDQLGRSKVGLFSIIKL